jgi:hypothetical protein
MGHARSNGLASLCASCSTPRLLVASRCDPLIPELIAAPIFAPTTPIAFKFKM